MRRTLIIVVMLVAGLAGAPAVLAGGWAITTLDQVPTDLTAGLTYRVGFTVLQHGARPADGLQTAIAIQATESVPPLEFPAHADGEPGHYVAEVRFPSAGEWTWEVRQGGFGFQKLGSVTVSAPSLAVANVSSARQTGTAANSPAHLGQHPGAWRWPLAFAALTALLTFAAALRALSRPRSMRVSD